MPGVPFVDLGRMHAPLKERFMAAFSEAVDRNAFVLGPAVQEFEAAFASYCGAGHCVGVAEGTSAIVLALRAVGVSEGDEVITVPNSFIATAAAIKMAGGTPVFVDVDETTQLMDVSRLEAALTERTKAIVPVHLFGQPVDMDPVIALARSRGLAVVEDAAQAHGARYKGRRVGSPESDATCFSFYPGKNLGALGEGGAVVTNSAEVADRIRRLRDHGQRQKYHHEDLGMNSRLHAIQARFLSIKLERLDEWNESRRKTAKLYGAALSGVDGIVLPEIQGFAEHVWHLYVVRVPRRDEAIKYLGAREIGTGIHYPIPIHLQAAFGDLDLRPGSYPVAEKLAGEILSLPMFPGMSEDEVARVAEAMAEFVRS